MTLQVAICRLSFSINSVSAVRQAIQCRRAAVAVGSGRVGMVGMTMSLGRGQVSGRVDPGGRAPDPGLRAP